MIKNKFKASLTHLLLSAIIISLLVSLVIVFWFPPPFLGVTDFKDIALIIISIDLILGPLLTFVVFNPNKKSLKFDLSIIVSIQAIALGYGLYMLYLTHPVYITYYENKFHVIPAKQSLPQKAKYKELKVSKLSSPTFAYMNVFDNSLKDQLFNEMIHGAADIEARSEYYEPYINHLDEILDNSLDPNKVFSDKDMDSESKLFIEKNSNIENYAFLPLSGTSRSAIIVLDKVTGQAIATIKTDPWKYVKK